MIDKKKDFTKDAFHIFRRARSDWMLENQKRALEPDYNENADQAGLRAVISVMPLKEYGTNKKIEIPIIGNNEER